MKISIISYKRTENYSNSIFIRTNTKKESGMFIPVRKWIVTILIRLTLTFIIFFRSYFVRTHIF